MAISEYLNALVSQNTAIANALRDKGADVPDNPKLNDYPSIIEGLMPPSVAEKVNYSFGLLSDVHLRDTNYGADTYNSAAKLEKALTYFKNNGCSFATVCGDIVWLGSSTLPATEDECKAEWLSEVELFKSMCNTYFPDKKVYVCTGNHDANPKGSAENLSSLSGLTTSITNEGTTKTGEQWWKTVFGTELNHVVTKNEEPTLGDDDVLIFFSMKYWNYVDPVYTSALETETTPGFTDKTSLDWLADQLEAYKNKRVLLFFHLPLTNTNYLAPTTNGLLSSQTNVHEYNRGIFGRLMLAYSNVVWISGHSHYVLEYQDYSFEYDDEYQEPETITFQHPNMIKPDDLPLMLHCCSVCYPRHVDKKKRDATTHEWDGTWSYTNDSSGSEAYIVDVYDSKIVVRGIDLEPTETEVVPKAQYCIGI